MTGTRTRTDLPADTTGVRVASRLPVLAAVVIVISVDLGVILLHRVSASRWALLLGLAVFAAIAVAGRRVFLRLRPRTVIIITAVCQLPGIWFAPVLSDDSYRYVWDGRVQLAGIDPYRYTPLAPALTRLRDPILFPPDAASPMINRPWVHTIYPPVAELWFTLVASVTPWRLGVFGVQLGAAVLVVLTVAVLIKVAAADPTRPGGAGAALLYGCCPATTLEAANAAHVDTLAALLLALTGLALLRRRRRLAGLLLGLAGGVKLVPLLLLPVFLRRGRRRTAAIAVATFAAGYLPHLVAVGALVIGYLPGYLGEEGFDGRRRFALLLAFPEPARLPIALLLAAGVAALAVVRARREPVLLSCCWLYGAAFLIATPAYPWYLLPYVVVVIMARRWEWLALWPAAYLGYLHDREPLLQTIGYTAALLVILAATLIRRRGVRRLSAAG